MIFFATEAENWGGCYIMKGVLKENQSDIVREETVSIYPLFPEEN